MSRPLAVALPAERRIMARLDWADENCSHFEPPARGSFAELDIQALNFYPATTVSHSPIDLPCLAAPAGDSVALLPGCHECSEPTNIVKDRRTEVLQLERVNVYENYRTPSRCDGGAQTTYRKSV